MTKTFAFALTLVCLLPCNLYAAEPDAAGCKDHPLLPRLKGYHIAACGAANASFDLETVGDSPETIHIEGDSWALAYRASAESQANPEQILNRFERAVKKYDGTLVGRVNSTPVYRLADGGKEIWVVLMADSIGGGYAYRIIEKGDLVQAKVVEDDDKLKCAEKYGPPLLATLAGYEICGCGEQESGAREFRPEQGSTIRVQGRVTQMTYCPKDERKMLSDVQVRRRFENQIKKMHGTFVGHSVKQPKTDVYKLTRDGMETWVEVWAEEGGNYNYVATRAAK